MPPEGAPALLHERIAAAAPRWSSASCGRRAIASPDPELTAHALSSAADEAARLLLPTRSATHPARILDHARWLFFSAARQQDLGMP